MSGQDTPGAKAPQLTPEQELARTISIAAHQYCVDNGRPMHSIRIDLWDKAQRAPVASWTRTREGQG